MTLKRKQRVNLQRLRLVGQAAQASSLLERYVNHILDVLQDPSVVLAERDPSEDPEDGELLFYDEKLYLAINGKYYQVYPATTAPVVLPETDAVAEGEAEVACTYPYPAETVLWADVALGPATANQAVISGSSGKKITLVYLEVNNPDTTANTEVYFHFSSDGTGTKLFRKSVPFGGGTVVQNFIGAQPQGSLGTGLYATTSGSATDDLYVTVGYVLL